MIRFTEAVKQYSEEKKARGLSSVVTSKELARIRQLYKEGKFNEEEDCNKDGDDKNCDKNLKENVSLNKRPIKENKAFKLKSNVLDENQKKLYDKTISELRDYKEAKGLGRGLSSAQKKMVERTILCGTLTEPTVIDENEKTILAGPRMKENKAFKFKSAVKENKNVNAEPMKEDKSVNKDEVLFNIREARRNVYKAKRLLKENDMLGATDATQAAGDAVNAADAAIAPAAEGAVPQNIVDAVSNIKQSVDDLAVQCGIESPVDPAADPAAGVPAVDGTMQDPNAGTAPAAAPVMEGNKLDAAKARLAKREAMLKAVKEGTDGQDALTQTIAAMTNPQQFHDIDKKNSEELVVPTTAKSKEAANTWPTVKGTYKEESLTEKMISDRIAEEENNWNFSRILREGILG